MYVRLAKQELFQQEVYQRFAKLALQEHILSQFLQLVLVVQQDIYPLMVQKYVPHVHQDHLQIKKEVLNVQTAQQVSMLQDQLQLNVLHVLQEHIQLLFLLFAILVLKELLQLRELLNALVVQLDHFHLLEHLLAQNVLLELFQQQVKLFVMVALKELMLVHKEL